MRKAAVKVYFWIIFAVIPTVILFTILIFFYSPLQGIGHKYFYARGTLLDLQSNVKLMKFEESSTFWDTSDVAPFGGNLELLSITNPEMYQQGQKVIIKGTRVGSLGQISNVTIYKDHFQPIGVDWRKSVVLFIITLTGLSFNFSEKMFQWTRIVLGSNRKSLRIS